jgi:acyl-CoA-binding protein
MSLRSPIAATSSLLTNGKVHANCAHGMSSNNKSNGKDSAKMKEPNLEIQFKAACDAIQNLPKNGPFQPSNEMLLKFYGYFKQATQGPCNTSRPSMFKVVERAKYDAWFSVRHLSREQAMKSYIEEIKKV